MLMVNNREEISELPTQTYPVASYNGKSNALMRPFFCVFPMSFPYKEKRFWLCKPSELSLSNVDCPMYITYMGQTAF